MKIGRFVKMKSLDMDSTDLYYLGRQNPNRNLIKNGRGNRPDDAVATGCVHVDVNDGANSCPTTGKDEKKMLTSS